MVALPRGFRMGCRAIDLLAGAWGSKGREREVEAAVTIKTYKAVTRAKFQDFRSRFHFP
jgi:hypothetical protein